MWCHDQTSNKCRSLLLKNQSLSVVSDIGSLLDRINVCMQNQGHSMLGIVSLVLAVLKLHIHKDSAAIDMPQPIISYIKFMESILLPLLEENANVETGILSRVNDICGDIRKRGDIWCGSGKRGKRKAVAKPDDDDVDAMNILRLVDSALVISNECGTLGLLGEEGVPSALSLMTSLVTVARDHAPDLLRMVLVPHIGRFVTALAYHPQHDGACMALVVMIGGMTCYRPWLSQVTNIYLKRHMFSSLVSYICGRNSVVSVGHDAPYPEPVLDGDGDLFSSVIITWTSSGTVCSALSSVLFDLILEQASSVRVCNDDGDSQTDNVNSFIHALYVVWRVSRTRGNYQRHV